MEVRGDERLAHGGEGSDILTRGNAGRLEIGSWDCGEIKGWLMAMR